MAMAIDKAVLGKMEQRIKELEDGLHQRQLTKIKMIVEIDSLRERIEELQDGSCRHHCRTVKEAFIAGFDCRDNWDGGTSNEQAYKEWKASAK